MTRFKVYNRDYEVDFDDGYDERRYKVDWAEPYTDPWVVESVDGGAEFYYASHEDAINSIYEGSK